MEGRVDLNTSWSKRIQQFLKRGIDLGIKDFSLMISLQTGKEKILDMMHCMIGLKGNLVNQKNASHVALRKVRSMNGPISTILTKENYQIGNIYA